METLKIDQIRSRAYQLYCERNGENGSAESDWCQAEENLRDDTLHTQHQTASALSDPENRSPSDREKKNKGSTLYA